MRPVDPVLRLCPTERLKVAEIFLSLQGESSAAGRPCVFVRLVGCQMRCRWCDTPYAFHGGEWMTVDGVVQRVMDFGCDLVEVTGGEPLLQPGARPLLSRLADRGLEVLLETGGGLDVSTVDPRVRRILDVKCPGSGEVEGNRWPNLEHLTPRDELKFVVADQADYDWTRRLIRTEMLAARCPIALSPVWGELSPVELGEWIVRDRLPVRLQLPLHKLLWGSETRGV